MKPRVARERLPGRFLPLLISLVGLFLLYPLMVELGHVRMFRVMFILVLVGAVFSQSDRPRHMAIVVMLAIPTAIGQVVALAVTHHRIHILATVLSFCFIAYVFTIVLSSVLRSGRVTGDKISGSICAYLLLGLGWALIYGLIAVIDPEAFAVPENMVGFEEGNAVGEHGFIYYSFVTLTTLGYGDVTPLSSFARAFAWMEAATGQLYIAILVARLVALQIIHSGEERGSEAQHVDD